MRSRRPDSFQTHTSGRHAQTLIRARARTHPHTHTRTTQHQLHTRTHMRTRTSAHEQARAWVAPAAPRSGTDSSPLGARACAGHCRQPPAHARSHDNYLPTSRRLVCGEEAVRVGLLFGPYTELLLLAVARRHAYGVACDVDPLRVRQRLRENPLAIRATTKRNKS